MIAIHHKRTLNFTNFKNNVEGNIWSLFWYGKILFNYSESRFYIEVYLALMNNDNYFLGSINKDRIEKITIPFTKSILFPLSSQFNYEGKFLRMSNLDDDDLSRGLYKFSRIQMNNFYNFETSNLNNILFDTLFPDVYENGKSIYEDCFYMRRTREIGGKTIEYIIPIDVILKYFLGFSSLILDLLITNRMKYAIHSKSFDSKTKKGELYYDSDYITRSDASLIAKYYFTNNKYAERLIYDIGSYFSNLRL